MNYVKETIANLKEKYYDFNNDLEYYETDWWMANQFVGNLMLCIGQ